MELTGKLKKAVEKTSDMSEKSRLIENAGMKLTDDELDEVAGGVGAGRVSVYKRDRGPQVMDNTNANVNANVRPARKKHLGENLSEQKYV